MNEEFPAILKYCNTNKLSINLKKTNYMIITNKLYKPNINIANIQYKSHIKYLGVYLDDKLNWSPHIQHVNNKLAKNSGILRILRNYFSLKMLRQIYYSLVFPYINYALLSWGNTYKTRLTKIITKQNMAIRNIFFANTRETAAPYYNILGVLKVQDIFKLKTGCWIYKLLYCPNKTPIPFRNIITLSSSIHPYQTRYASNLNLQRPKTRTNYKIHTFQYAASFIWQTIPLKIKQSKSHSLFKSAYKQHLSAHIT